MAWLKYQLILHPGKPVWIARESFEATVRELRIPRTGFSAGSGDEQPLMWIADEYKKKEGLLTRRRKSGIQWEDTKYCLFYRRRGYVHVSRKQLIILRDTFSIRKA